MTTLVLSPSRPSGFPVDRRETVANFETVFKGLVNCSALFEEFLFTTGMEP